MLKMDVNNEHFYDEIASFMPQSEDYSVDDLDEIIRSADAQFNASLDINGFPNYFTQNDFDLTLNSQGRSMGDDTQTNIEDDCQLNFSAFPSPATSNQSAGGNSSPFENHDRTYSISSIDDDHFNPDDFINFLNDDIKMDDLTNDTAMKLNENCRNTPSPTGSCTSSSGSSTSGIQSDASSVASMSQNYKRTMTQEQDDDLREFIKFKNVKSDSDNRMTETIESFGINNSISTIAAPIVTSAEEIPIKITPSNNTMPITFPVLPVTSVQPVTQANFIQGTIIPLKTVPLTTVNSVVNVETPTTIKVDNNPPLIKPAVTQSVKVLNNPISTNAPVASPKVMPPPNSKPKTIFLSSNDFKTLMQKMNANGKRVIGDNGQMPKIIMKTANGKVITANKLTRSNSNITSFVNINSSSSTNSQSLQFEPKVVKACNPKVVKQQSSKAVTSSVRSAAVMAAARATLGNARGCRNDLGMLKGLNDEKLLKKQLRMLKNRESASLSRKKKKEYVERLENRINNLEKENYSLKGENSSLRSQLMAFAQTCNCKHRNVSEFILNTLNMSGKECGAVLNTIDTSYVVNDGNYEKHLSNCASSTNSNYGNSTTIHHVKIAPKPANAGPFINKGFKQRMNSAAIKKNFAILFVMAFMVTLNVGNLQSYLNKSAIENSIDASTTGVNDEPAVPNGRRLLWVPNEHEFHEQTNRSKREIEMTKMPPPPLHFLHPINRTTADKMNGTSAKDEPHIKGHSTTTGTTTTTYANATQENMRLARNLHKWIGGNDYLNLTGTGNGFEHMAYFKFGSGSYMDYDMPLQAPIGMKQKRKIIINSEKAEKHPKLHIDDSNSLDIFKPKISDEYLKLFKGIKRQDDTFYVLSFNMDHILLPASTYNKSSRPKMSLMLPAGYPSHNGDIVLMQIDCEVINTTELEIKSYMIPEKLRPSKYSSNVRVNPNAVDNNEASGTNSATASKPNEIPARKEELKEKPSAPRTYFMMGPKNQSNLSSTNSTASGTNNVKKKPTILKLSANDSVIGSGVLNVRNSTLFSRMRETVGSHTNSFVASADVKKLI